MAQHDYLIDNAAGLAFRNDLNNALAAIISQNSATTEPATKVAYMWWADTTTAILKQRNAGNTAWNSLFNLTTGQWLGASANVAVSDAASDTTTWPMLARSQTGDQGVTTDAGLTYDAANNVLTAGIFSGQLAGDASTVSVSAVVTGAVSSSSPTAGVGYATGAGGSVTQLTSITTSVTLNKVCGQIVCVHNGFTAGTMTNFLLFNSSIATNDIPVVTGADARFIVSVNNVEPGYCQISIYCVTPVTTTMFINFSVMKAVVS